MYIHCTSISQELKNVRWTRRGPQYVKTLDLVEIVWHFRPSSQEKRLTQLLAQINHGVERFYGEVDLAVEAPHVRQLYSQSFVHRCEVEERVRCDTVLIQGASRSDEPVIPLGPP